MEEVKLPKKVEVTTEELGVDKDYSMDDEYDEEVISDWLSDTYGYCHEGFRFTNKNGKITITGIKWDTSESLNESKEELKNALEMEIAWCKSVLNNPKGSQAMDAKANYGKDYIKRVKDDLARFEKRLSELSESLNEDAEDIDVEAEVKVEEPKEDAKEPKLETFEEKIDFLIGDEDEAIAGYDKILAMLGEDDANAIEQLTHLKEEEIAHRDFLEVLKKDPSAIYNHEEKEEEPKENDDDKIEVSNAEFIDDIALNDIDDAFGESLEEENKCTSYQVQDEKGNDLGTFDNEEDAYREKTNIELSRGIKGKLKVVELCESLDEDTVKKGNKWVNKGKEGTHGEFKTKKEADDQRKAMFANGYHEDMEEDFDDDFGFNNLVEENEEEMGIKVDWDSLDDEDAEIIRKGNEAHKKLMGVKQIRDAVVDDTLKDFPERKRDVIKKALDMKFEKPIEEDNHEAHTGHIKAKEPIKLKAKF